MLLQGAIYTALLLAFFNLCESVESVDSWPFFVLSESGNFRLRFVDNQE